MLSIYSSCFDFLDSSTNLFDRRINKTRLVITATKKVAIKYRKLIKAGKKRKIALINIKDTEIKGLNFPFLTD
jgi:hypothetical protein